MTTVIDYNNIKNEIVWLLRNNDILTTTQRSVTTTTEEFDGTGAQTTFTVAHSNMKNVRSVTVGGVAQTYGTDYTINTDTYTVTFTTPPESGTDNVDIQYDYGTDKIFTDLPKTTLTISNFPRIGINIIGDNSEENELSGDTKLTRLSFSIIVYDTNTDNIDTYLKSIRTVMLSNQKSLYYLRYIRRLTTGPLLLFAEASGEKVMQRNVDYLSDYNIEVA